MLCLKDPTYVSRLVFGGQAESEGENWKEMGWVRSRHGEEH